MKKIDKTQILKKFVEKTKSDLASLEHALDFITKGVTHAESKQESKYDTRGLEASYLAGGQQRRVEQTKQALNYLTHFQQTWASQNHLYESVLPGALVIFKRDEILSYYLYCEIGGGINIKYENKDIKILGPESPLGRGSFQLEAGDQFEVELVSGTRTFEIFEII